MEAEAADEEQSSGTPLLTPKAAWSAFADPFFHAEGSGRKAAQQAWEKASAEIKTRTLPKLTLAANNLSFVIGLELPAASSRSQPKFVPVDLSEFFYALFTSLSAAKLRRSARKSNAGVKLQRPLRISLKTAPSSPLRFLQKPSRTLRLASGGYQRSEANPCANWSMLWLKALLRGQTVWSSATQHSVLTAKSTPNVLRYCCFLRPFSGFINRGVLGWKAFKGPSDIFEAAAACCSLD